MANILTVDADTVSRSVLKHMLENQQHDAIFADTLDNGWRALTDLVDIDLVILDNQLKNEFGWELLTRIRRDLIFRELPVLLYTSTTDKAAVMKYLQLGVQNILPKPFNPQKITHEISRAIQVNWRDRFFESAESVCSRLAITEDDYCKLLNSASEEIKTEAAKMKQLIGTKQDRKFHQCIESIQALSDNLGIPILNSAAEYLTDFSLDSKIQEAVKVISQLEMIAKLMQHRFAKHFGIATQEDTKAEADYRQRADELKEEAKRKQASKSLREGKTALGRMLGSPLVNFAMDFIPYLESGPFKAKQTFKLCTDNSNPFVQRITEICHWSLAPENSAPKVLRKTVETDYALNEAILEVVNFKAKSKSANLSINQAIDKLGTHRVIAIIACHRIWKLSQQHGCPINLLDLARHSLGCALLTHELTLKLNRNIPFALLGAFNQIGTWLLAMTHPGYYGMALSLSQGDRQRLRTLEKQIFGIDKNELGARFFQTLKIHPAFSECALYCHQIEKLPSSEHQLGPIFVHLGNILTHASNIGFSGSIESQGLEAFTTSPAWKALLNARIRLPLKPEELLNALIPVIERVNLQVMMLLHG